MVKASQPPNLARFSGEPAEVALVRPPYRVLLEWQAPSRPYKQRNREYYTTIAAVVFLLAVILLFLKEWLLIGAIISLAFLAYVLASVPPENVDYKITTRGIEVAGKTYTWNKLGRFWFTKRWDTPLIHIEHVGIPTQLLLLFDEKKVAQPKIKEVLDRYLFYEKPEKTPIDKAAEWLQKKLPLETESPTTNSSASK